MHSAAHETRLLQQVRTRCKRVDVCAPRRIQRADLNCFPAGGDGAFGQSELAAKRVDGGLATLKLGHVGLVLALGSKAEALVNSVDDGGVLGQQDRRDCPGGKKGAGRRSRNEATTNATHPKPAGKQ